MSSCKAPNCDLKNFDQCNSSLQFCSLQGIGGAEEVRDCSPKDSGTINYLRELVDCEVTSSVNAEFECGKKVGCEWNYLSIATNDLLEKKCIRNRKGAGATQASYTCSEPSPDGTTLGSWKIGGDNDAGRFSMQEQDTFGCPKDKCNYIPRKSVRVDGECVNITEGSGCGDHTTKGKCLNEPGGRCKWEPNDSAYCGYNRTIKKTLGVKTNFVDFMVNDENDVCRKVTNPSEEVCNHWGCIWDIKGERNSNDDLDYVDYDITTSGICTYPDTENCKNNYCSQNTRSSASGKRRGYHPDGRCTGGVTIGANEDDVCESSKEMIIPHKTPGLMKLSGHTSDENTEISNLQRVIDEKQAEYKRDIASGGGLQDTVNELGETTSLGKRSEFRNEIKELYHQSCEKRGKYPGPADQVKIFTANEYDVSLKECRNRSGDSDILDLCGIVKNNYESNEYKPYLGYSKSGECLFTGYEGDKDTPAMKAAEDECGEGCLGEDNEEKILMFGRNECISATGRNDCINVDFGGTCFDTSADSPTPTDPPINTKEECLFHKWTGTCTGNADDVDTCTGTARDATANPDCSAVALADCVTAGCALRTSTPICDLEATTDGSAECPEGCAHDEVCSEAAVTDQGKGVCEGTERGDRDWVGAGYCQWHDPGERCRVKEESFNIVDCNTEDSHPLCVQDKRSDEPIDELPDLSKTEAMKIRCSTTDCSGFINADTCVNNSAGGLTGCVHTPALEVPLDVTSINIGANTVTLTNTVDTTIATGQLLRLADADNKTCAAQPKDTDLTVESVSVNGITFSTDITTGDASATTNCVLTRAETCVPGDNNCTDTYENNGMCLNRDGEEITCRIGPDGSPAIYMADEEECTDTNSWINNKAECTNVSLGYHWYLPPVSDGCRNIPDGSDPTHTCVSKWMYPNGPLKQHLECRKNYYRIHSDFKTKIKTILDRGDKKDSLYNFLIGRNQDGSQEDPTAYWELQEQYRSERHVGVGCVGTATTIPASCTGTADDAGKTCDLDSVTDGTGECPTGCDPAPETTPTCDLDDSTAVCPVGCIHIHEKSACDDQCENIKHKIHQIIQGYTLSNNHTNDEIINNLVHYFITLIQIKDSFDIDPGIITDGTITLAEALPIISTGDTVQIVGNQCTIITSDGSNPTINSNSIVSGKTALTLSNITGGADGEECKLKISPNCKYDVERNLYRVDSEESRNHAGLYQLSTEDYPIITPDQDSPTSDNWTWDDDITTENYENFLSSTPEEMKHIIKDIEYATGKATILLEITSPDNSAVSEEKINAAFKLLEKLNVIPFTVEGGKQPKIKLKEQHPLVNVTRYFDGMIEIEIDGVDPGKIENDRVEYPQGLYIINLDNFSDTVHVREIRFHDIQMDIYFDSDIHNLYKKNDIIEIEKFQDIKETFKDNFNKAYRLKSKRSTSSSPGPIYNKITDVDFIKNKITVDHIKRKYSGKYFPGRYRTEPKGCIVETITTIPGQHVDHFTPTDYDAAQPPHCDYKRDIWKTCLELDPTGSGSTCYDTNEQCRDRQITVDKIDTGTYCMKNGVEEVSSVCDRGVIEAAQLGWTGVEGDAANTIINGVDTSAWNTISLSYLVGYAVDVFITNITGFAVTNADTATLKNVTDFRTKVEGLREKFSTRMASITANVSNVSLGSPTNDLQTYSEAIKGVTDILNEIKGLIDELIKLSSFDIGSVTEYPNLSTALNAIEDILEKNNRHISHHMNNVNKVNMIKVHSDYATQVQELLKPRGEETEHTIKLLMNNGRTVCAGMAPEEAKVLGTKTEGEGTYIIIDQFIDIDPSACKLEIASAGNLDGFDCIPNDVRFNGKIDIDGQNTLAKYFSCNEIQHEYDLPNRLERKMCGIKTMNNKIIHDSMFEKKNDGEVRVFVKTEDKYSAPHGIFSTTTFKDGDLNDWVIEYIVLPEDHSISLSEHPIDDHIHQSLENKKTGTITYFTSTESIYSFKIQLSVDEGEEDSDSILPLSIYEKVKGFDKGEEQARQPSVSEEDKRAFTIKNYIRKDVNELPMMKTIPNIGYGTERLKYFPGINTRSTCEYNNGIWEGLECKSHDVSSRVRNIDICENTGYNWKKEMNVCMFNGEYNTKDKDETENYCGNKTTQDSTEEPGENAPTNPCPTCKYDDILTVKICKTQQEDDCMKHTTKELCGADKTCEYYIDRMETPGPGLKPQAVFNCGEKPGVVGDSSVCITQTNRPDCEGAKCEWQCPFTPDSRNQQGYVVKTSIDGVSDPNPTLNNQTDNYYAPSDLTVTCDTTWEQSETSVDPSITCIENVDPDPRVDEHTHRMASVGCRPKINCGENKIDDEPITGEVLRSLDLNQVPDVFKTGTGNDEAIDPTKLPNSQGSFKCPAPQTLRNNASGMAFWSKEQCCYSTGLCKDNTEPGDDVECPTGKIHKKAYYGESTEYLPAQGTTQEVCCIVPEVPTITIPLDADYDEIAGSAGTTLRDTFEQNFCTDIVTILNASDHIDVPITSSMCEILDINDGSVVVTFRLNKDTNGNVVLTDQLSKAISSGTTFPTVGAVSNAEPHYKPFDPKAKYLFWSDTLKKGITIEQLIITIFMIVCIISSGLAVMGILLK